MARHVPLTHRRRGARAMVAGLGFALTAAAVVHAQTMMTTPAPAMAPATNAPAATPPANAAAAAKPPVALSPPVQDTLGRYGKILAPGDEVTHPLKLHLPNPGVGEVKVPRQDELVMREKLEELAKLSDDDIRKELAQWPPFAKMNLRDQGGMLQRIQDFRDYHSRVALQKAHDMGLLTLTPDQKAKFEKDYWDQRLRLDQELAKQFLPVYQAREQKMDDALFREFSSAMPGPKPSPPPAPKPPQPPAKPIAINPAAATTNGAPLAQAPH